MKTVIILYIFLIMKYFLPDDVPLNLRERIPALLSRLARNNLLQHLNSPGPEQKYVDL